MSRLQLTYSPQPQVLSEEVRFELVQHQVQAANRSRRKASNRANLASPKQSKVPKEVYSPIKTDTGVKRGVVVLVLVVDRISSYDCPSLLAHKKE